MSVLRRVADIAVLAVFFLVELVRATGEVGRMVVTPGTADPAVIAIELHTDDPWVITTFANLLSLTPGSLTLEVADDRSEIYVHVLTTRPLEDLRADLMGLQQRVLKAMT